MTTVSSQLTQHHHQQTTLTTTRKEPTHQLCPIIAPTPQPNTISPTTASDLTTERSSRIDKLLAQLATKNTTLEATQNTMQSALTKLQEQVELSLERTDSIATTLNKQ